MAEYELIDNAPTANVSPVKHGALDFSEIQMFRVRSNCVG
jgi:hypothetical protein